MGARSRSTIPGCDYYSGGPGRGDLRAKRGGRRRQRRFQRGRGLSCSDLDLALTLGSNGGFGGNGGTVTINNGRAAIL